MTDTINLHKDDDGNIINPPRYIETFNIDDIKDFEMSYFIFEDEILFRIWGIGMGWHDLCKFNDKQFFNCRTCGVPVIRPMDDLHIGLCNKCLGNQKDVHKEIMEMFA